MGCSLRSRAVAGDVSSGSDFSGNRGQIFRPAVDQRMLVGCMAAGVEMCPRLLLNRSDNCAMMFERDIMKKGDLHQKLSRKGQR